MAHDEKSVTTLTVQGISERSTMLKLCVYFIFWIRSMRHVRLSNTGGNWAKVAQRVFFKI